MLFTHFKDSQCSLSRIALVDCNNFYVSCERVFRPDLWGKPVAVLSNNDGCIVARSQEVKNLGIKMGIPVFQIKSLIKRYKIQLFSSNYPLYADMSARVMSLLAEYSPQFEVYSIDEAFLDLTGVCDADPIAYGLAIRKTVLQNTGITVCVGMGQTKTLAKLANYAAKKWQKTGGIVDLSDPVRSEKLMRLVAVNEVWGVGSRLSKRLNALGIITAWDLASKPVDWIQTHFNIVLARIVLELNGISCESLADTIPAKQEIVCSRSFKRKLTDINEIAEALSEFSLRAAEKLRRQQSIAGVISVTIRTNPNSSEDPFYQRSATFRLNHATQDSREITRTAKYLLQQIYKAGYRYQKCAVQLSDIRPKTALKQLDLFEFIESDSQDNSIELMKTIDKINNRYHKGITLAATGLKQSWQVKPENVSQRYTCNWNELAIAKCC